MLTLYHAHLLSISGYLDNSNLFEHFLILVSYVCKNFQMYLSSDIVQETYYGLLLVLVQMAREID